MLSFGIMRQNIQDVAGFPDLALELGAEQIVIHPVTYQSQKQKEELSVAWQDLLHAVDQAKQKAEALGLTCYFWDIDPDCYLKSLQYVRDWQQKRESGGMPAPTASRESSSSSGAGKKYCSFLWRNAMIQGEGEVFPCCYITNFRLGTLENQTLFDMRNHPFLVELKQRFWAGNPPSMCAACPQLLPFRRKQLLKQGWKELQNLIKHR